MPNSREESRNTTVYAAVSQDQRALLVKQAEARDRPLSMFVFLILRNATRNFTDFSIADRRPSDGPLLEREHGR